MRFVSKISYLIVLFHKCELLVCGIMYMHNRHIILCVYFTFANLRCITRSSHWSSALVKRTGQAHWSSAPVKYSPLSTALVPPYWTSNGDRIHYISKDCSHRQTCLANKEKLGIRCKRDWYNDWECIDCCSGDLCNYYATVGGLLLFCACDE